MGTFTILCQNPLTFTVPPPYATRVHPGPRGPSGTAARSSQLAAHLRPGFAFGRVHSGSARTPPAISQVRMPISSLSFFLLTETVEHNMQVTQTLSDTVTSVLHDALWHERNVT